MLFAVAGTTAAAVIKHTNLLPVQRVFLAGASAGITSGMSVLWLGTGAKTLQNISSTNVDSNHTDLTKNKEKVPSSDEFLIPSILENDELTSPLEYLLSNQIKIGVLIMLIIFLIFFVIFNMFFTSFVNRIILIYIKLGDKFTNFISKSEKFYQKFYSIILGINILTLIFGVLLSIFISSELTSNLDDYILVHNELKKSFILIFTFLSGNCNSNYTIDVNNVTKVVKKIEKVPTLDEFLIPSILEKEKITNPLEYLLSIQLEVEILILLNIFLILFVVYNKIFGLSVQRIILIYIKLDDKFTNFISKSEIFYQIFFFILLIILNFSLIFNVIYFIGISSELTNNLEKFIVIHKELKKSF